MNNTSGEAADQVMKMMLEGTEVLVRLSGSGAKQTAILLYSVLMQQKKTSGAARLSTMLRSGKPLKVYTFRDEDLESFQRHAKEYGVLFCVLKDRDKSDGVFDVLVRAEDSAKLTRIVERYQMTQINAAEIKSEVVKDLEKSETEKGEQEKSDGEANQAENAKAEEASKEDIKQEAAEEEAVEIPGMSREELAKEDAVFHALMGEEENGENPLHARTEEVMTGESERANEFSETKAEGRESPMQKEENLKESPPLTTEKPSVTEKAAESEISDDSSKNERSKDRFERPESVRERLARLRKKREQLKKADSAREIAGKAIPKQEKKEMGR